MSMSRITPESYACGTMFRALYTLCVRLQASRLKVPPLPLSLPLSVLRLLLLLLLSLLRGLHLGKVLLSVLLLDMRWQVLQVHAHVDILVLTLGRAATPAAAAAGIGKRKGGRSRA